MITLHPEQAREQTQTNWRSKDPLAEVDNSIVVIIVLFFNSFIIIAKTIMAIATTIMIIAKTIMAIQLSLFKFLYDGRNLSDSQ